MPKMKLHNLGYFIVGFSRLVFSFLWCCKSGSSRLLIIMQDPPDPSKTYISGFVKKSAFFKEKIWEGTGGSKKIIAVRNILNGSGFVTF